MALLSNLQKYLSLFLLTLFFFLSITSKSKSQSVLPVQQLDVLFGNISGNNPFADPDNVDENLLLNDTYRLKAIVRLPNTPGISKVRIRLFDDQVSVLDSYSLIDGSGGLPSSIDGDIVYITLGDYSGLVEDGSLECILEDGSANLSQPAVYDWSN